MDRECGECIACCVWPKIAELNKPLFEPCKHLKKEANCTKNCSIYKDRPSACRTYKCEWLKGYGKEEDRPDKSLLMFDNSEGILGCVAVKQLGPNAANINRHIIERFSRELNKPVIIVHESGQKIQEVIGNGC
jgi:Fe-S-cluster containining protein